jgi:hypothetical protein
MLAQAIQALESAEHDADVSEAEAIRNRLLALDAEIGNRIQAKLNAHRMIVESWGVPDYSGVKAGTVTLGYGVTADEPIVATDTAEQQVIEAMVEVNDWMGKPDETLAVSAEEWAKHHETFHTVYAQSGDEITEPVLEVSVAEIQQAELVTES